MESTPSCGWLVVGLVLVIGVRVSVSAPGGPAYTADSHPFPPVAARRRCQTLRCVVTWCTYGHTDTFETAVRGAALLYMLLYPPVCSSRVAFLPSFLRLQRVLSST